MYIRTRMIFFIKKFILRMLNKDHVSEFIETSISNLKFSGHFPHGQENTNTIAYFPKTKI